MFKRKTRIVSFRLSDEEFRDFRNICVGEGFGSFSDLIRVAVTELIANRNGRGVEALRTAMERLNSQMEQVGQDLKQLKGSSTEAAR